MKSSSTVRYASEILWICYNTDSSLSLGFNDDSRRIMGEMRRTGDTIPEQGIETIIVGDHTADQDGWEDVPMVEPTTGPSDDEAITFALRDLLDSR